ncbi:hypothetical protein GCM10010978_31140 [Compostibacillus humi]|uniref:Uncharacterized protein n=1 Tax=Compostibacillus humi TaxID=1245525 RepID=A0A8J2XJ80_9BACI|nr:hypothetical protein GCM10010978_31140 [Compostibacillus humi]
MMKENNISIKLFEEFNEIVGNINQDLVQENANVDGKSPMGIGLFASTSSKYFAIEKNYYLRKQNKLTLMGTYISTT